MDLYTGKIIGSQEIPSEVSVGLQSLKIRSNTQDSFRFIEDKCRVRELFLDESGLIPYIREILGDNALAKSIAERTGFKGAEDLLGGSL